MIARDDWLSKFIVNRPHPIGNLSERFEETINNAQREEDLQEFLARNPFILSEQLPHGTHVVPKFRFGGKYISDFLISEVTSGGTFWVLVELEPANIPLVTGEGNLSQRVRGGVQQVRDWRDWLTNNRDHAIKPVAQDGLGLGDIEGIRGWVVVGRRSMVTPRFNQLRRQLADDSNIEIMTYDRLLDWFKKRAKHWKAWDASIQSMTNSKSG
jgi:Domain of unknown function (DUF4263)